MSAKSISIVKGSDVTLTVNLTDKATKEPYSLAGFTGASGYLPGANGVAVVAPGSVVSSDRGILQFPFSDTLTALLEAGEGRDFQVIVDQGTTRRIVLFEEAVNVLDQIF